MSECLHTKSTDINSWLELVYMIYNTELYITCPVHHKALSEVVGHAIAIIRGVTLCLNRSFENINLFLKVTHSVEQQKGWL